MVAAVDNGIWLQPAAGGEKIPVEFGLSTYEIRPSFRGWEPWRLYIHYTYDDPQAGTGRFDALENPIKLIIKTVGKDGAPFELELNNWFILNKFRHSHETGVLSIADIRSQLLYTKLTRGYNVEVAGANATSQTAGKVPLRNDTSADGQGSDWTAVNAIKDALQDAALQAELTTLQGFSIDEDPEIDPAILAALLPRNLSNSPYGGFAGARYQQWTMMMGQAIRADIIPTPAGGLMIVDRYKERTADLLDPIQEFATAGRYGDNERRWEQPKKIIVQFRKRVERDFLYIEQNPPQTSSNTGVAGRLFLENVIPVYQESTDPKDLTHAELFSYAEDLTATMPGIAKNKWFNRRGILERVLVPGFLPDQAVWFQDAIRPLNQTQVDQIRFLEDMLPQTVRRRFRVKKDLLNVNEQVMPLVDLSLGRLNPDGTTRQQGVFMDHIRVYRFGRYPTGSGPEQPGGTVLDQVFSENVPFDDTIALSQASPSPFIGVWLTEDPDDLIFELRDSNKQYKYTDHIPGLLIGNGLRFPNFSQIVQGLPFEITEASMALQTRFKMRVLYNGVQVAPVPSGGGLDPVMFEVEDPAPFANGTAPALYILVDDITANFRMPDTGDDWPGVHINQQEVQDRADYVIDRAKRNFENNKRGSLRFSGAWAANEVPISGNIFDVVVEVGKSSKFSINTWVFVAPEVEQIEGQPPKLEGLQPRMVGT